jgi:hypothetical protein
MGLDTLDESLPQIHTQYMKSLGLSPVNQEQNESLQSENTGFLAVLRFILHYQTYYKVKFENCT